MLANVVSTVWSCVICFCLLFFINPTYADHSVKHLPAAVTKILNKYKVPEDSLSLYIKEINEMEPLVAINTDTSRNPASVIKILTTYAALELLGPNYNWETHIHIDGTLKDETLNGNLIIEGRGDPFLDRETFWHLLFTLRNHGLKHIKGNLLIDDEFFENEKGSPADFDKKPYRVYNTFPDAALLNFRAHQFNFVPQDGKVIVYADPPASNLEIRNKINLITGSCRGKYRQIKFRVIKQRETTLVEFAGNYPAKCGKQDLLRTVLSNDDYIYGVFKALWESMDGTISGTVGNTSYDSDKPFYVLPSKPLSEIIVSINKFSNNVMSRQLLLTVGAESFSGIGSKTSGKAAIYDWLDQKGINRKGLLLDNGSGLSRDGRVTALTLAEILQHAVNSVYQPEFFASLPLVGVDGTVRKRLNGKLPPSSARIKTGIVDNVRSMAGYVKSKSGKNYLLVSLQNYRGIQNTTGTLIQDEILKWLYTQ